MNVRFGIVTALVAFSGLALLGTPITLAQSPTQEPTKRPYVFPTPIFIPTYPNDTPQPPPTRAVSTTPSNTSPSATIAPEQQPSEQTYTVQSGDSLWIIAQKVYGNGAKYPLIANANNITTATRLRTGMVLKIPSAPGLATITPTSAPPIPTSIATRAPTVTPPTNSPIPAPTPTAASLIPASIAGPAATLINVFAAICALAALGAVVLAYFSYARARRLARIAEGKPPIRLG